MRSLMRNLRYLYNGLVTDPHRFAPVWNLIVTLLQFILTLFLAIIFGVSL